MKVGVDGTVYGSGTGTVLVDPGLYAVTKPGNVGKYLKINVDGVIYASDN
jgi:hypothetical protein